MAEIFGPSLTYVGELHFIYISVKHRRKKRTALVAINGYYMCIDLQREHSRYMLAFLFPSKV